MKNFIKLFLTACLLGVFAFSVNAQSVGINSTGDAPNSSAILDVSSTTKGFLPPRMTTAERDLIVSPVAGLTIFNTTKLCNETYNGTMWVTNAHYIGESYGGGIVFYVYDNGQHGLIAATADQSSGMFWGPLTNVTTNAVRDGIGAGMHNTERIIVKQGADFPAHACASYQGGGYGDWYLPSGIELNLLFAQKAVVGGFVSSQYWSSNESGFFNARFQNFNTGSQFSGNKGSLNSVRAIRAF
jgi:hypothetical protein